MRTFIAIEIEDKIKNEIGNLIEFAKKNYNLPFKWVKIENLHITLHFLGEIPDKEVENVKNILRNEEKLNYKIKINNLGQFPEKGIPRVLWIGFEDLEKNIEKSYKSLEKKILNSGLKLDKEKFVPHITIGRIKKFSNFNINEYRDMFEKLNKRIKELNLFFETNNINLFKSELFSEGPIYTKIL
jgi:2'-5' RNA ligase